MASRKHGKRAELAAWIENEQPAEIGEAEWRELQRLLAPISDSYLRQLLREWSSESGVPLAPLVEGIRQESLEALEASLIRLSGEYERGDVPRRTAVRRVVIEAKTHARWVSHKRGIGDLVAPQKDEMISWMLTWLENPPLFPQWVRLRKAAL